MYFKNLYTINLIYTEIYKIYNILHNCTKFNENQFISCMYA